nr:MAG TPA: hypothetical protein [Caudoviricetes sp.]
MRLTALAIYHVLADLPRCDLKSIELFPTYHAVLII